MPDDTSRDVQPDDVVIFDRRQGQVMVRVDRISGFAVLKLPFQEVVARYTFQWASPGHWTAGHRAPILTVEVDPQGVFVTAHVDGCAINGRPLPLTEQLMLHPTATLSAPGHAWTHVPVAGPMCRGVLLGGPEEDASRYVSPTQPLELGRMPTNDGLWLPTRKAPRIAWCDGDRADRARSARFTLDRALVGRRHASIKMQANGSMTVIPLHPRCPTLLLDDGLMTRVAGPTEVRVGDQLVMGISLVEVSPAE